MRAVRRRRRLGRARTSPHRDVGLAPAPVRLSACPPVRPGGVTASAFLMDERRLRSRPSAISFHRCRVRFASCWRGCSFPSRASPARSGLWADAGWAGPGRAARPLQRARSCLQSFGARKILWFCLAPSSATAGQLRLRPANLVPPDRSLGLPPRNFGDGSGTSARARQVQRGPDKFGAGRRSWAPAVSLSNLVAEVHF